MGVKKAHLALAISLCCLEATPALAQTIGGGSCGASNLSGTYSLTLSGRGISTAGSFAGSFQAVGTATFDGQSKVTLSGTYNTNLATGKAFTYSGTYTLPSNCYGTVTLTQGSTAAFALIVYGSGDSFNMTGADAAYVYSASGGSTSRVHASRCPERRTLPAGSRTQARPDIAIGIREREIRSRSNPRPRAKARSAKSVTCGAGTLARCL